MPLRRRGPFSVSATSARPGPAGGSTKPPTLCRRRRSALQCRRLSTDRLPAASAAAAQSKGHSALSEKFTSRWGLLIAALGMAVGTGNIWRFPRILAQNGGGAFLIPWLLFLFVWAIPTAHGGIRDGSENRVRGRRFLRQSHGAALHLGRLLRRLHPHGDHVLLLGGRRLVREVSDRRARRWPLRRRWNSLLGNVPGLGVGADLLSLRSDEPRLRHHLSRRCRRHRAGDQNHAAAAVPVAGCGFSSRADAPRGVRRARLHVQPELG